MSKTPRKAATLLLPVALLTLPALAQSTQDTPAQSAQPGLAEGEIVGLPAADSLPAPVLEWSVPGRQVSSHHPSGVLLTQSGAEPQTMRAMDPETGALGWSLREEAAAIREIEITAGGWLILSHNAVREVRARDGAEMWRMLGGAESVGDALHTVAFCKGGVLRAYAPPSPQPLWEETCAAVDGNGSELVASSQEGLKRLDPASGALVWELPEYRAAPLVLHDSVLLHEGDELLSLGLEQGELLWSRIYMGELHRLLGGELISWSVQEHTLSRVDPSTGDDIWSMPLPQGTSGVTLADGDDRYLLLLLQPVAYGAPPIAARVPLDGSQMRLIPLLTRPLSATLLSDGDLLVSSPQGTGRLDLDTMGPAWSERSATEQLAAVRAWPLGHPAELSGRLIALLQADPSPWPELLATLPTAQERELLMLLDAIDALRPDGAIEPLLARAAAERPGPLRRHLSDTLFAYPDAQLTEHLVLALERPTQRVLARELLLDQGQAEGREVLAQALESARSEPYFWDCAAEFFCEAGLDGDGDGWPDSFEAQLGTDPASADSDGDGLADAQDPCPMMAQHGAPDPRHQVALEVLLFGQAPGPMLISAPVCFAGVPGPQVPNGEGLVAAGFGFPGPSDPPEPGAQTSVEVNFVTGPRKATGFEVALIWQGERWVAELVREVWRS